MHISSPEFKINRFFTLKLLIFTQLLRYFRHTGGRKNNRPLNGWCSSESDLWSDFSWHLINHSRCRFIIFKHEAQASWLLTCQVSVFYAAWLAIFNLFIENKALQTNLMSKMLSHKVSSRQQISIKLVQISFFLNLKKYNIFPTTLAENTNLLPELPILEPFSKLWNK